MNNFVNTAILLNPINWLIVVLILIFGSYGLYVLHSHAGSIPLPQI